MSDVSRQSRCAYIFGNTWGHQLRYRRTGSLCTASGCGASAPARNAPSAVPTAFARRASSAELYMFRASGCCCWAAAPPAPPRAATMRANGDCAVEKLPGGCTMSPPADATAAASTLLPASGDPGSSDGVPGRGDPSSWASSETSETVRKPRAPLGRRVVVLSE